MSTYSNFDEETIVLSGWSENLSLRGWQLWHSMFYAIFNNMTVKPTLLQCKFKWWHVKKYTPLNTLISRSQWPRRLRHRSAAAPLLRLWVRIPPGAWMPVSCECCVLTEFPVTSWSLVQRSSTDFGGSCVWSRNLMMVRPWPALGGSATGKKKYTYQSKVSDKSIHEIVSRPPQDSLMTQILGRGP